MKHLKTYSESVRYKGITYKYEWATPVSKVRRRVDAYLKDIILEAIDLGYGAHTDWVDDVDDPCVWIGRKLFSEKRFDKDEISDIIEHVKNYLLSEGFEIEVRDLKSNNPKYLNQLTQIWIYFRYPEK